MSQKGHAFPASLAWLIDSPVRRWYQPASELVEKLAISQEQTVVDFGCGPGYFTVELAKRAGRVVAVDLQEEMLKKAQRKVAKADVGNVEFLQSDGVNIQLPDGSVDLILLVTVFHEIGDTSAVLKEFSRILKPTGKVAIVEMIKKGLIPFAPVQNPKTLQAEVEAEGFQLQQLQPHKNFGLFNFIKT